MADIYALSTGKRIQEDGAYDDALMGVKPTPSDCQGERISNGPDTPERRMSAAGALHRLASEMLSEFGWEFAVRCLTQEASRCKPKGE